MQRYAQLLNRIVVNVIESAADPDGINGEWVACGAAGPGYTFDGTAFHPPVAEPPQRWVAGASFKRRLTQAERIAIRALAAANAQAFDFVDLLESASYIDLDDPLTRTGLQAMEAAGCLTPGRALEVLDAPVQEKEKP